MINSQIKLLIKKGVISPCQSVTDQYISKIFLRPKPDGSSRLILNLKSLNKFVKTEHFKIEDCKVVKKMITKKMFSS